MQEVKEKDAFASFVDTTIVKTDVGAKDGQDKCPKCGSTDISLNVNHGKLRCNFCRCEFEAQQITGIHTDISTLEGNVIGSGATNIVADTKDALTFKCSSCGAEVVIDTSMSAQARCHWCRNTLSVNQQIPNGSVPDMVLPFSVRKEEAKAQIEKFVGKRKFFAHPKFREEFTTENIMGVYFPYMLVDINSHANLIGRGEKLIRMYTKKSGNSTETYYDADLFEVEREFDLAIHGLTIESSSERLNKAPSDKTNNVINAIMPFDTENCVKYNANYLKGFTSERRDTDVDLLKPSVEKQAKDVARFKANDTLKEYNRGVCWSHEQLTVKGEQWMSAYLPVWLYSYQQVKSGKQVLHYVAVNARTKETMGSVPIHMPKLLLVSTVVEILGILLMLFMDVEYGFLFFLSGFIYFFLMLIRYRNANARHHHEVDTKSELSNLRKVDHYVTRRTRLTSPKIDGANNTSVQGVSAANQMFDSFVPPSGIVSDLINGTENKKGDKL